MKMGHLQCNPSGGRERQGSHCSLEWEDGVRITPPLRNQQPRSQHPRKMRITSKRPSRIIKDDQLNPLPKTTLHSALNQIAKMYYASKFPACVMSCYFMSALCEFDLIAPGMAIVVEGDWCSTLDT